MSVNKYTFLCIFAGMAIGAAVALMATRDARKYEAPMLIQTEYSAWQRVMFDITDMHDK